MISEELNSGETISDEMIDAKSHPLVGQTLTIGHHSYAVRSLLAECGYALVFAVEALKKAKFGRCVCKILYATAQAINHMHDRNPPITQRDIKIENLLFDAHGHIKMCDFGGATTEIYRPCDEWSALVRSQVEEEIAKFTTPMYRAPEVLDTYRNFPIGPAQDIWVGEEAVPSRLAGRSPNKLVYSVHEQLAKAIFTELNDAWTEFQKNASIELMRRETCPMVLDLHEHLMWTTNTLAAGEIRSTDVEVCGHVAVPFEEVPAKLTEFLDWFDTREHY
ncbi:hypothetical protein niasHS_004538 [Heterodera schachtii]|uniref:Protein kinase domain-containing protein n=1 Tax=Heterodera schachtii TaxID=97005 RepID=A0ABD2JMN9_HETSC